MKTIEFWGLQVSYTWTDFGYEGDRDVPGGLNHLGYGADDITVEAPDGTDLTEYLSERFYEALDTHIAELEHEHDRQWMPGEER